MALENLKVTFYIETNLVAAPTSGENTIVRACIEHDVPNGSAITVLGDSVIDCLASLPAAIKATALRGPLWKTALVIGEQREKERKGASTHQN